MKKDSIKKIGAIALALVLSTSAVFVTSCTDDDSDGNETDGNVISDIEQANDSEGESTEKTEETEETEETEQTIDIDSITFTDEERSQGYAFRDSFLIIINDNAMVEYNYQGAPWYENKENIKKVIVMKGVTNISQNAFSGCEYIKTIAIPDSVTNIDDGAFADSIGLISITVDANNEHYSNDEYGVLFNKDKTTILQYSVADKRTSYTIPDSVICMREYAFENSDNLTSITIPNGITEISRGAFSNCSALTKVTIPNSVTSIDNFAFEKCKNMAEITIPNSVTDMGEYTFGGCSALKEVNIPDSVTTIGKYAFQNCTGITKVTIPASVTRINRKAFVECSSLEIINFGGSEAQWNEIKKDEEWDERAGAYTVNFGA